MDYAIIAIPSKHKINARSNIDLRLFAIREMFTWHSMCHFKVNRPHNFTYTKRLDVVCWTQCVVHFVECNTLARVSTRRLRTIAMLTMRTRKSPAAL